MRRPLEGIRIVDLTAIVAGPVGTSTLGSLGAEVIRIENTPPPDSPMSLGRTHAIRRDGFFRERNHSKQAVSLNLSKPEAMDVFKRLVALSDVVIDNFSPRVMRNFKLEYKDLAKIKPDIIAVSMPAFGMTGPLQNRISFGPGIDAMSGLCHLTGYPDSTPLKPGNYYCDFNAAILVAYAITAAVFARKRTGKGQFVEVAMRDGETQLVGEYVLDYILNKRQLQRDANKHLTMAPHNVYPALGEDRWIAISVKTDDEWRALCGVLGKHGLVDDTRFATTPARKQNEEAIDAEVSAWTRTQDAVQAAERLQRANVAASPVLTTKEIAEDPQFVHRKSFQKVTLTSGDQIMQQRVAWTARNTTIQIGSSPEYSENSESVFRNLLGMSEAEIAALVDVGGTVLPG